MQASSEWRVWDRTRSTSELRACDSRQRAVTALDTHATSVKAKDKKGAMEDDLKNTAKSLYIKSAFSMIFKLHERWVSTLQMEEQKFQKRLRLVISTVTLQIIGAFIVPPPPRKVL